MPPVHFVAGAAIYAPILYLSERDFRTCRKMRDL
jgi:hypothetical protein